MSTRRLFLQITALTITGIAGYKAGTENKLPDTPRNTTPEQSQTNDDDSSLLDGLLDNSDEVNAWGKNPVTVRITEIQQQSYNTTSSVQEALSYWETNSETYTNHTIEYQITDSVDADITIRFISKINQCGVNESDVDPMGCAPLIQTTAPAETIVEIASTPYKSIAIRTIKHELGHTLGLGHDDEPQPLMKAVGEILPNQEERIDISTHYENAIEEYNTAVSLVDEAIRVYRQESYAQAARKSRSAITNFEEANNEVTQAREIAVGLGLTQVVNGCDNTNEKIALLIDATRSLLNACNAVNPRVRRQYLNTASSQFEDADQLDLMGGDELMRLLEFDQFMTDS